MGQKGRSRCEEGEATEGHARLVFPMDSMSRVLFNEDILQHIFLRLTSHSTLVRASLVCKGWLGVVRDDGFLRRFRSMCLSAALGFFYLQNTKSSYYIPIGDACRLMPNSQDSPSTLGFFLNDGWKVHDSYNGCLILSKQQKIGPRRCIVCNPRRHEFVAIPPPPIGKRGPLRMFFLNTTVASSSDALRLFAVNLCDRELRVWVCSAEYNNWKRLTDMTIIVPPYLPPFVDTKAIIIGKIFYWVLDGDFMLAVDINRAKSIVMSIPDNIFDKYAYNYSLATTEEGRLCLVGAASGLQLGILLYSRDHDGSDKWIFKEEIKIGGELANLATNGNYITDYIAIKGTDESGKLLYLRAKNAIFSFSLETRCLQKLYQSDDINDDYPKFTLSRTAWPPYLPTR